MDTQGPIYSVFRQQPNKSLVMLWKGFFGGCGGTLSNTDPGKMFWLDCLFLQKCYDALISKSTTFSAFLFFLRGGRG